MASEFILKKEFFNQSLKKMAALSEQQRDYWSSLDSDIGDGDHGINLSIGFRAISNDLLTKDNSSDDINSLYKKAGMILLSKVGGASGPLYGSFFMKMGQDVIGKTEVSFVEFLQMIKNGILAIQHRGKAEIGDKTMIDSFLPGLAVIDEYISEPSGNEIAVFEKFVKEMKKGSDTTIPLVAKKGRAMRLGERAIGHRDPGSESSWMLMNIFLDELKILD